MDHAVALSYTCRVHVYKNATWVIYMPTASLGNMDSDLCLFVYRLVHAYMAAAVLCTS